MQGDNGTDEAYHTARQQPALLHGLLANTPMIVRTSSFALFGFLLGASNTSSLVVLVSASSPEGSVDLGVFKLCSDSSELGLLGRTSDREVTNSLLGGTRGLEYCGSSVVDEALLWLVLSSGEENELVLVAVKSIHVHLELMFASVGAAVINRDADGASESGAELSVGKFLKSEAPSIADLTGVLAGGRGNNGT